MSSFFYFIKESLKGFTRNLSTTLGSIGVLANHAAMVCALADGRVRCTYENGGASEIDIGAGIAEVADNQVTLLVSDAKLKQ